MNAIAIFIAQYLYIVALLIGAAFFLLQLWEKWKDMAICGAFIAIVSYVISRIAGALYYDPRPFVVGHFIPLIAHAADNGFPSDHVLLAGAVAMVIWFYNKKISIVLWVFALLIGWARVYIGIHHVTDIIGSIVIVLAAGSVYALFEKRWKPSNK